MKQLIHSLQPTCDGWRIRPGLWALIAVLAVALLGPTMRSQSGRAQEQGNHLLPKLVGAWSVQTTVEIQQATFPALLTFTSDGIVLADEPPSPFETTGHGNWMATGPREAAFTFRTLIGGGPDGQLSLSYKLVGKLQYDAQTDTWSGPFKIHIFDREGNEIFVDRGTFTGSRISVELLD